MDRESAAAMDAADIGRVFERLSQSVSSGPAPLQASLHAHIQLAKRHSGLKWSDVSRELARIGFKLSEQSLTSKHSRDSWSALEIVALFSVLAHRGDDAAARGMR